MKNSKWKNSKWQLIGALSYFIAGVCFVFAAALQAEMVPKALSSIAAACLLIGGIGLFCT